VGHVESCFGLIADGVSITAREVHGLHRTYHRLENCFRRTRWYFWVTRLKWQLILVRLEIVPVLTQDRCMVCAERTIDLEIMLTHLMELVGDMAHVESCFSPFRDSVTVRTRLVHGLCQMSHRLRNHFGRN
jgi:hypothetical protein